MPVDMTVGIATIIALASSVIAVTAMFVTLRERVSDHEIRIQHHSSEIRRIDCAASEARTEFARISVMIAGVRDAIEELKRCQ